MNKYKYLIINTKTDEITIVRNLRDIEKKLKELYPKDYITHNTISNRFKEEKNKFFPFFDLIIKELIWNIDL